MNLLSKIITSAFEGATVYHNTDDEMSEAMVYIDLLRTEGFTPEIVHCHLNAFIVKCTDQSDWHVIGEGFEESCDTFPEAVEYLIDYMTPKVRKPDDVEIAPNVYITRTDAIRQEMTSRYFHSTKAIAFKDGVVLLCNNEEAEIIIAADKDGRHRITHVLTISVKNITPFK